jgi:beta-glucosidase
LAAYLQAEQQKLSVDVSERTLQELYFPAFKRTIEESNPVGIMTAYNGLYDLPTSASYYLISDILKKEWGFQGFVMSDWRSVVSKNSIVAGLDIEMPGPGKLMGTGAILKAIQDGSFTEKKLNDKVARYIRALIRLKLLDKPNLKKETVYIKGGHDLLAREVAEASIVLLKNEKKLLPLNEKIESIAVIGPNALEARLGGGGSASVSACYSVSPLQGLENLLGKNTKINFSEGTGLKGNLPVITSEFLRPADGLSKDKGLSAEFYNNIDFKGDAKCSRIDDKVDFSWGWAIPCENVGNSGYAVRWTGKILAPETGSYKIGVSCTGAGFRLFMDGKLVIDEWGDIKTESMEEKLASKSRQISIYMDKRDLHDIKLEYYKKSQKNTVRLEWEQPNNTDPIQAAVEIAKKSNVAIIFAGLSNLFEGGGNDRENIDLPGKQNELISAVADANPNTIVVLINGTPIAMPWINKVKSVVEAFYPGQEGGNAIARVLFGVVNPSGKLPDSYPVSLSDNLAMKNYPGTNNKVNYKEDLFIGHRQYERDKTELLFPFGFGLSYTSFKYDKLKITKLPDKQLMISVNVKNTGTMSGAEIVQLYIHDIKSSVDRPYKELKGFEKVFLAPGETKTVVIHLSKDSFSFFDEKRRKWVFEPADFDVLVGSSSRDILLKQTIAL